MTLLQSTGAGQDLTLARLLPGEFDSFAAMWWFPHAATIAFFFAFSGVRGPTIRELFNSACGRRLLTRRRAPNQHASSAAPGFNCPRPRGP